AAWDPSCALREAFLWRRVRIRRQGGGAVGRQRAELAADVTQHASSDRLTGHADRVLDRARRGLAVTDDGDAVDPEQRRPAVLRVIQYPRDPLQVHLGPLLLQLPGDELVDETRDGLVELQQHIAGEAIRDQNVADAGDDVATLDVAHEIEPAPLQEAVGLHGELIPLLRLLSDVQEADPRARTAQHVLRVHGAQASELEEVAGLAVHARPPIDEDDRVLSG